MAVKNRDINEGLIFHSGKGFQYASKKFVNVFYSYKKITRSMSSKGNCRDNVAVECFFKSLKRKFIYGNKLISKEQMKLEIFDPSKANWRCNTLKFGTIEKEGILV